MSSIQQETPDLTRCGGCGQKAKKGVTFKICSGCGFEAYCSAACQGKGWSAHKAICKIKKKEREIEREKECITFASLQHNYNITITPL
jgi:hypothetical protein